MFGLKINKSQRPDDNSFVIHDPHNKKNIEYRDVLWQTDNNLVVVSIDPGIVNLAIRIEQRPLHSGSVTDIKTLFYHKHDFSKLQTKDDNSSELYLALIDSLDSWISEFLDLIHLVIIERQLPKNYKAVRVSQCIIDYFLFRLRDKGKMGLVLEIRPTLKSRQLKSPPNLNERGIKLWAIDKAIELLTMRQDNIALEIIKNAPKSKKDDLADTVVQIEAIFSYLGWKTTEELYNINSTPNNRNENARLYLDGYTDTLNNNAKIINLTFDTSASTSSNSNEIKLEFNI